MLNLHVLFTGRKRSLQRLCFYRCLSVHKGGGHARLLGGMRGCSGGGVCVVARGACVVALGGHVWLLWGGGVCGCSRGACVVALGGGMHGCSGGGMCGCSRGGMRGCSGGHVWLLWGGMHGCSGGCMVLLGGMRGCSGGACVVALGGVHGCSGGMRGCSRGGAWFFQGGVRVFFHEIRSMSGRYVSYWNAFLFLRNSAIENNDQKAIFNCQTRNDLLKALNLFGYPNNE